MKNIGFTLLAVFYITCLMSGFIPAIYKSDYNSFVINQAFWVFIFIITVILIEYPNTKEQLIICKALVVLAAFELIDEVFGLNSYLGDRALIIKGLNISMTAVSLIVNLFVVIPVTLFVVYKLWQSSRRK